MLSILDCLPRANRVSRCSSITRRTHHNVAQPLQATLVFLLDHLSLVVSASERNKMSAQALATVMGPPLMLHSSSAGSNEEIDHAQPIAVLKYLLQIWPQPQQSSAGPVATSGNVISDFLLASVKLQNLDVAYYFTSLHFIGCIIFSSECS